MVMCVFAGKDGIKGIEESDKGVGELL